MTPDVVVIGGGIIGALSAYELAKNGTRVRLVDKYRFGNGASGNSAAMLELQLDAYRGEPFFSLAKASHDLFPALSNELSGRTGIDIQFQRCSILQIALNQQEADALKKECARQSSAGLKAEWLSPQQVNERLPGLTKDQFGGILFSDDGQVNGSKFLEAAIAAARSYGAVIEENAAEFALKPFVESGGKAVIAAGAWTDLVLAPLGVHLGVSPVRGQLIVYETPSPVLPYPVYTKSGGYVTPKNDGTTLAGTTIENVGYNSDTTNEGQKHIIGLLSTLMPSLIDRPVRKITAGLRPKSPDDLPFIGALPAYPNVIVASGHYRNGILLAPITAKAVAALVSGASFSLPLEPFSPSRILSKA